MGTLGSFLQEARKARGLDLREAAQQTRISIVYLKAMEEEDFGKLPGEVFVKGFLKSYAKFLLLEEDEVMKRYGELKKPAPSGPGGSAVPAADRMEQARPAPVEHHGVEMNGGGSRRNLERFMWGGVAAIAVAAVILVTVPRHEVGGEHPGPVESHVTTTAEVTEPTSTVAGGKLYLEIEATEDTWVLVRTDASPQKHATLKKGELITWSADERFLLSYGSVGAVKLRLNGNMLEVAGSRDAVVRDLSVTASGIVAQKIEAAPRPPKPRIAAPAAASAPASLATPSVRPSAAPAPAPAAPAPAPSGTAPSPGAQPPQE